MKNQTPHLKSQTHERRAASATEDCQGTVSREKLLGWGLNQFYSCETLPLILMQIQITNISSAKQDTQDNHKQDHDEHDH